MNDIITPGHLASLTIDIPDTYYGGNNYKETRFGATKYGINDNILWIFITLIHTCTSLEQDFIANYSMSWSFKITPISAIKETELNSNIYDCLVFVKEKLEAIINEVYSHQSEGHKYVVVLPSDIDYEALGREYILEAVRNYFLS